MLSNVDAGLPMPVWKKCKKKAAKKCKKTDSAEAGLALAGASTKSHMVVKDRGIIVFSCQFLQFVW